VYDLIVRNARLYPMGGDARMATYDSFAVRDGRIAAVDIAASDQSELELDAEGRCVLPGFIDCHTHLVWAGERMAEHVQRLEGRSYQEIASAGGGINSTVLAVRRASDDELVEQSRVRLRSLMADGVTTVEIKSGYGLSTEDELRMLRAARRLGEEEAIEVVTTFLGAHAVPPGMTKAEWMDELLYTALPRAVDERLVDQVDIYVEGIAFDVEDLERMIARATRLELPFKAHSGQFSEIGGTTRAAQLGALSCDHLEFADENAVRTMAEFSTVAVILPGAYYFLGETQKPPIESLRAQSVPMAVATDLNPGSSPVASLLDVMHLAGTLFGMRAEEILLGVTANAARALGRDDIGRIAVGCRADFSLWDIPGPEFLCYQLGGLAPTAVYQAGVAR
jgi:imidazolonepropionase